MKRVLILCTGNSCRSQMAQALWNQIGAGRWQAFSAGSRPSGYVHPLAIRAMGELGVDISKYQSKNLSQYLKDPFDLIVTVCDNAKEACPIFPGAKLTLHWPFDDPAEATGDDEQKMAMFRRVREEIRGRIAEYLKSGQ